MTIRMLYSDALAGSMQEDGAKKTEKAERFDREKQRLERERCRPARAPGNNFRFADAGSFFCQKRA